LPAPSYTQLLRQNRDFRLLWTGQVISLLGDWFNFVTLNALLLKLTGSAESLAGIWIAQALPPFFFGPAAGVVVDRLSRKRVMIGADLARAAVALGFLSIHDAATAHLAYPLLAGLSFFSVFFEPARTATVPNITSEEELVTANALSAVTWSIILASGATVGGLAAHFLGYQAAFILNSLSFLGSAWFVSRVRIPPTKGAEQAAGGFREMLAGFRYVRHRPAIAALLTAKPGWGLAGGSQLLTTIYGQRLFPLRGDRDGVLTVSLLVAVGGIGTAFGPIVARRISGGERGRMRWAIPLAFLLSGAFLCLMGSARSLTVTALALFMARFGGSITWVFSTVLLQLATEDRYRGRVFAAETSLFTLTMMLSNVGVGRSIDVLRVSPFAMAWLMGGISLVCGLCWLAGLAVWAPQRPAATAPAPAEGEEG
jgi:MFS family permease